MMFNGTRLGAIIQTILYITGVQIYNQNSDSNSMKSLDGKFDRNFDNINKLAPSPHPTDPKNVMCYGVLGCIRVKYPSIRGFHQFPESLAKIKPDICLQHNNETQCQYIEIDSINRMLRASGSNSYWVAHGYIETNRLWVQKMVKELLAYDKTANVFTVDWKSGSQPPYRQAVVNTELLGAYVGHIMSLIEEVHGLKTNESHFIGHSLGSHMGGFVGAWLKRRGYSLGRISGLDPAQPYFESLPPDVRLDPTDALFVDVIHTDAKPLLAKGSISGLGTQEPSGHVDFYPNNGKDQPGCSDGVYQAILQEEGSFLFGFRRFIACDHIRAYEYFTESIASNCSFTAFSCSSWDSFTTSQCKEVCIGALENCNKMGFHAKRPKMSRSVQGEQFWSNGINESLSPNGSILYYSMTGGRSPYCREHFLVTLKLSGTVDVKANSDLHLQIIGKSGRVLDSMVLSARDLHGGTSFNYTIPSHHLRESIKRVVVKPIVTNSIWWIVSRVSKTPDIKIDLITIRNMESYKESKVCPAGKPLLNLSERNANMVLTAAACETKTNAKLENATRKPPRLA